MNSDSLGSSPLSRGIPARGRPGNVRTGIIPALAGNTSWWNMYDVHHRDHPRSRGEYEQSVRRTRFGQGSSPLSRGIRTELTAKVDREGIIPALAGNTEVIELANFLATDHPRSRGEYDSTKPSTWMVTGSSPLSRGIRRHPSGLHLQPGIIPALAGNTHHVSQTACPMGDHPRSRGEYPAMLAGDVLGQGSSPLSRGIRPSGFGFQASGGIIPALAGNTVGEESSIGHHSDHPRSRGEYAHQHASIITYLGSSPLSRGILPPCFH